MTKFSRSDLLNSTMTLLMLLLTMLLTLKPLVTLSQVKFASSSWRTLSSLKVITQVRHQTSLLRTRTAQSAN